MRFQIFTGIKHGKGILTNDDGSIYIGQGEYYYPNGELYERQWLNDEKHGKGSLTFDDGTIYDGDWKNGKMDGDAKMMYANNDVYEGKFENNKRNGWGNYQYMRMMEKLLILMKEIGLTMNQTKIQLLIHI